jgi:hypothetical protein
MKRALADSPATIYRREKDRRSVARPGRTAKTLCLSPKKFLPFRRTRRGRGRWRGDLSHDMTDWANP